MKKTLLTLASLSALLVPTLVLAAPSISFESPRAVVAGDVILVPVFLSVSEAESINSLAARVSVTGPVQLTAITTGGSVFTLWPETPTIISNKASFTGGVPGSVYGAPLRVVTLVLTTTGAGNATVTVDSATAYAGDGKGSSLAIHKASLSISISAQGKNQNAYAQMVAADTVAPDPFSILLGQDPSVAANAYFITFQTTDSGSGVSRYEVAENGGHWVAATSPLVLSDQTLSGSVSVRAYDAAGNVREETLHFKKESGSLFEWVISGLLLIALFSIVYLKRGKRV